MTRIRAALAAALCLSLVAPAAPAQQDDTLGRPAFLSAMGLLEQEPATVAVEGLGTLTLSLPVSEDVRVVRQDIPDTQTDVVAGFDFVTGDGILVESLVLTRAQVDPAAPEARRFAMANLLVLRSFPSLEARMSQARLLGFGPVSRDDDLLAVQMVGTFETEGTPIFFRHVGLMAAETETALVALTSVNVRLLPVRNERQVADTYAGVALDSLRIERAQDEAEE